MFEKLEVKYDVVIFWHGTELVYYKNKDIHNLDKRIRTGLMLTKEGIGDGKTIAYLYDKLNNMLLFEQREEKLRRILDV